MTDIELKALPLTSERFAPFGDVIAAPRGQGSTMNAARFDRFHRLARTDCGGDAVFSIARARTATTLPYRFDTVERHPLASQAFIPLRPFRFVVVVARAGDGVSAADLSAFVTNGAQGVNYHRGVWHMPLIALEADQEFLIVDRPGADNFEEQVLETSLSLRLE